MLFLLSHDNTEMWYNTRIFLGRSVHCAGKEAEIRYNDDVSKMCMMDEIRAKRDEIYAIARKHKAEKLWVFGSCARREVVI